MVLPVRFKLGVTDSDEDSLDDADELLASGADEDSLETEELEASVVEARTLTT
ncbi:hypothetical protein IV83_GL000850 [Pediococcus inopinatus]|nr:hypothetical protein IV83_GL000850 [Pediococcus inopinatus]